MTSSTAGHTPGPWRPNSSWIEGPQMALRVASVDWPKRGCAPKTIDEAKANARLIAAAPELLVALETLLEEATSFSVSGVYFDEDCMGHKGPALARAAITAATGGAS